MCPEDHYWYVGAAATPACCDTTDGCPAGSKSEMLCPGWEPECCSAGMDTCDMDMVTLCFDYVDPNAGGDEWSDAQADCCYTFDCEPFSTESFTCIDENVEADCCYTNDCEPNSDESFTCTNETGSGEGDNFPEVFAADCCTDVDGGSGFNVCPTDDVMNGDAMTC